MQELKHQTAHETTARSARTGPHKKDRRRWPGDKILLLWSEIEIRGSAMLRNLLCGWQAQSTILCFSFGVHQLPRHLTIEQTILLYLRDKQITKEEQADLGLFLTNRGVKRLQDLQNANNEWLTKPQITNQIHSTRQVGEFAFDSFIDSLTKHNLLEEMALHQCNGWHWDKPNRNVQGLDLSQENLGAENYNMDKLNRRWRTQEPPELWSKRWKQMWSAWMLPRVRIFI